MSRKLNDAETLQITTFLTCGAKQTDLAEQFKVSRHTIWKIARRAGFRKNNTDPLSPEMEARGIQLLREGRGEPYISRTLGVSRHRIRQLSQRHLLAQTGSRERRVQLSELEERGIRTQFRAIEKRMAAEFNVELEVIQRLLRRRK
jgi:ribosomal protein S14